MKYLLYSLLLVGIVFWVSSGIAEDTSDFLYSNMVEDFEGEVYLDTPGPDGWYFKNTSYGGTFTWEVDPNLGANDTNKSLKMTVTEGVPYFYYLNNNKDAYINENAELPVNRMQFYIKFPQNWRKTDPLTNSYNSHVGTYDRDPNAAGDQETHNWHFYHHLIFDTYDDDWIQVDLNMWPQHQRSYKMNPGVNPTKPIAHYFQHMSRIYFTGVPYYQQPQIDYPYNVWFDEFKYYYQNEYLAVQPEYYQKEILPGGVVYYPITITNTHPAENRRFGLIQSTNLFNSDNYWTSSVKIIMDDNGNGIYEEGEDRIVNETPLLGPNEKFKLFVRIAAPNAGAGSNSGAYWWTAFIAYQKEPEWFGDPHIIPGVTNFGIPLGVPAVSTQIITNVVNELSQKDTVPPSPGIDLQVVSATEHSVTLEWTATGNDKDKGTAYAYDIRYTTYPITLYNFEEAFSFIDEPAPKQSGSIEKYIIPPILNSNTKYYFAMKTYDKEYHTNTISNIASGWTIRKSANVNQTPVAKIYADKLQGDSPLTVSFSSTGSYDSDGEIRYYKWEFGDGAFSTNPNPVHTYNVIGTHKVLLTIMDDRGSIANNSIVIQVTPGSSGIFRINNASINQILSDNNANYVYLNVSWATKIGNYGGKSRLIIRFKDIFNGLPQNSKIAYGKLRLYQISNNDCGNHVIEAYPVKQHYDEKKVTWDSPWQLSGAEGIEDIYNKIDAIKLDNSTGWREWDITPAVLGWQSGNVVNNGVLLKSQNEISGYSHYAYNGYADISKRPILEIGYTPNNPVFTMSGTIKDRSGKPIIGVYVILVSNTRQHIRVIRTDNQGYFVFGNLKKWKNYSVYPIHKKWYFSPKKYTVYRINTNQSGLNFIGESTKR